MVWISFFKCYVWIFCWKMYVILKFSFDYKLGILLSRIRLIKNDFWRNMYGNNFFGFEIWILFNLLVKLGNYSVSFVIIKNRIENKIIEFNICIDKMLVLIWIKFFVKKLWWILVKWRLFFWNENNWWLCWLWFLIV